MIGSTIDKVEIKEINVTDTTISVGNGDSRYAGGLIGNISGTNADLIPSGKINISGSTSITGKNVGGIAGVLNSGEIKAGSTVELYAGYTLNGATSGVSYMGGVAGSMKSSATVQNIKLTGQVALGTTPKSYGGITSVLNSSTITSCENGATITGDVQTNLGGIVGEITSSSNTIQGCKNTVGFGKDYIANVGGILGYISGSSSGATIKACSNSGDITASENAGGLIGKIEGATVSITYDDSVSCINDGNILSAGKYAGGFVGYTNKGISITGSSTVAASNRADVRSTQYSGGIVGYHTSSGTLSIRYSINSGTVNATSESEYAYSGGIIGYSPTATVYDSENSGSVSATSAVATNKNAYAGGIIGKGDNFTGGTSGSPLSNTGPVISQVNHEDWFAEAGGIEAGEKTWSGLRPLGIRIRAVDEGEWLGFDYYKCGSLYVRDYYGYAGGIIGYGAGTAYGINNGTITGSLLRWIDNLNQYKPVGMDVYCKATAHWIETRGYIAGGGTITAHAKGDTLDLSSYTLNSPPEEGSGYDAILSALQSGSPPVKGGSCQKAAETGNFPIFGLNSKECQGISASWGIAWCAKQIYA